MVKDESCEEVTEVRRCDRVMAVVLVFEEKVVRMIFEYGPQSGRGCEEREKFYDELAEEWEVSKGNELVWGLRDFHGRVGKSLEGFDGVGVHGRNGIA